MTQFGNLCSGEITTEIEVHLAAGDGAHDELRVEDAELGAEYIGHQVDVLLGGDHNVVHTAATIHLLDLFCGFPSLVFNPARK